MLQVENQSLNVFDLKASPQHEKTNESKYLVRLYVSKVWSRGCSLKKRIKAVSTGLRPLPFNRPLPISQHGPRPCALPYIWSTTGKRDVGILESLSTGRIWDQLYLNPFVPFERSVVASAPSLLPWIHLLKNRTLLFKAANLPVALKTFWRTGWRGF